MTNNRISKGKMQANQRNADSGAAQGARRATEAAPESAPPAVQSGSDSEVVARTQRRQFSSADKRRILNAADRCSKPGEIGALMRREGVYPSSLSTWRRQREAAELAPQSPLKSVAQRSTRHGPRRCILPRSRVSVTACAIN